MIEAIWDINGMCQPVIVTGYLGIQDGKHFFSVQGSLTGIAMDELRFINPDDPDNPYTSVYIDNLGRINFAE